MDGSAGDERAFILVAIFYLDLERDFPGVAVLTRREHSVRSPMANCREHSNRMPFRLILPMTAATRSRSGFTVNVRYFRQGSGISCRCSFRLSIFIRPPHQEHRCAWCIPSSVTLFPELVFLSGRRRNLAASAHALHTTICLIGNDVNDGNRLFLGYVLMQVDTCSVSLLETIAHTGKLSRLLRGYGYTWHAIFAHLALHVCEQNSVLTLIGMQLVVPTLNCDGMSFGMESMCYPLKMIPKNAYYPASQIFRKLHVSLLTQM